MSSDNLVITGLIGDNIKGSLSPDLHRIFANYMNKNNSYLLLDGNDLRCKIDYIRSNNLLGVNVTKPFKVDVIDYLDEIEDVAKSIGAVNTVLNKGGKLIGYNTDYIGLYYCLVANDICIKDTVVVVLGAGGASRSAVFMAAFYGAKSVVIVNRDLIKAKAVAKDVNDIFDIDVEVTSYETFTDYKDFILINATSVGMKPNEDSTILNENIVKDAACFVDMIYNPLVTSNMKIASAFGKKCINGLDMLFYQALKSFEIWHEVTFTKRMTKDVYELFRRGKGRI